MYNHRRMMASVLAAAAAAAVAVAVEVLDLRLYSNSIIIYVSLLVLSFEKIQNNSC
jgi:hypothetical protein